MTDAQEVSMTTMTKRITTVTPLLLVLVLAFSGTAQAQRRYGGFGFRGAPRWGFGVAPFADPFWGPYYPYAYGPYVFEYPSGTVRVDVVPKHAEVFVDGYFAGTSDKVQTTPGGHLITLFEPGYRTVTQSIYVAPGATVKVHSTMDWLPPGETSAPPPRPSTLPLAGTPNQG